MPGVSVGPHSFLRRGDGGERSIRAGSICLHNATHAALVRVCRQMVTQWKRQSRGIYEIDPATVVALCHAIDRSDELLKGVG